MTNDHEWVGGKCEHEEVQEHALPWFRLCDEDYAALQKIVLDPKFLDTLKFYTSFRHTGALESANNLSLAYAGKRFAFR